MNTLDEEEIERLIACDKLLSMAEARIPQLETEIGRLTSEVEFRKEQIAELFDKQEEISRMAHQQEREGWATFILNSQIVRDEWEKVRGERSEFSADDAGLLIESALRTKAHDLHVARVEGALKALTWHSEQPLGFKFLLGEDDEWKRLVASNIAQFLEAVK